MLQKFEAVLSLHWQELDFYYMYGLDYRKLRVVSGLPLSTEVFEPKEKNVVFRERPDFVFGWKSETFVTIS